MPAPALCFRAIAWLPTAGAAPGAASSSPALPGDAALRGDSVLTQQRCHLGLAATKFHEGLQGLARAAARENAVEKTARRGQIEGTALEECAEGVGGQHLGPLIAVIARRIASGKNVREAV